MTSCLMSIIELLLAYFLKLSFTFDFIIFLFGKVHPHFIITSKTSFTHILILNIIENECGHT